MAAYKIAIASSDGEAVNQHFGQARNLLIYEIGDETVHFLEDREIELIPGEAAHTDGNMQIFAEELRDCSAIFVKKIGQRSLRYLLEQGIRVFEVDFPLNYIFQRLLKNKQQGKVRLF